MDTSYAEWPAGETVKAGALVLDRLGDDGTTVLEHRAFTWVDADTLEMALEFIDGDDVVRHAFKIVRR
ncbi:MAG: hypothetical protein LJF30_19770 [Acidobacteria bacterium]|jgi:hypothetical protein|nr:hypothetical protein [Acidobacteriota bacterium]